MQIVIDINEHLYKTIKTLGLVVEDEDAVAVSEAIRNGTPLEQHRNITNEEMYQQLTHLEAENERLHDALEAQPTEECEENGSPWCLGHCPYNTDAQSTDAVSREAVIKIIENKLNPCTDMFKCLEMSEIKEDVEHLPPVTPQRQKGKWIHPYKSDIACECSECHIQMPITNYYHYCPNCGAEMSGGDSE